MLHLAHYEDNNSKCSDTFLKKAAGRFYTNEIVGHRLAHVTAKIYALHNKKTHTLRVVDPFCGDGRLVAWLISSWAALGNEPTTWEIELWDINDSDFQIAQDTIMLIASKHSIIKINCKKTDSFQEARNHYHQFDIVITNPPWELLKPDKRELSHLPKLAKESYIEKMREYDNWISKSYPLSQPKSKFAGWGTNLSRVGFELCLKISRERGIVAAVLPASILADNQSVNLRKNLLLEHSILNIAYYPAEAKLYDKADISSIGLVAQVTGKTSQQVPLFSYNLARNDEEAVLRVDLNTLSRIDYVLPISFGAKAIQILTKLAASFPKWQDLEADKKYNFWAGREVDETGSSRWLTGINAEAPLFVKGRMIGRYTIRNQPHKTVSRPNWTTPKSINFTRIAWRDISRPSQKRRLIATILPKGWAAGNSLGVACFFDQNEVTLLAMLAVMNSTIFEFQLRAHLATSHVSLSSLRKISLPDIAILERQNYLSELVTERLSGLEKYEFLIDAYVAKHLYLLAECEYLAVLDLYPKLTFKERTAYLEAFRTASTEY